MHSSARSRRHVDAAARRELVDARVDVVLVGQIAQAPVDAVVGLALLPRGRAREGLDLAAEAEGDLVVAGDRELEREPPQPAGALRKAGRDEDGERRRVALEDRIRPDLVVAIAVVERDAGEAAGEIALDQPAMHLVERDDLDLLLAQQGEGLLEEFGRDLEQAVGLELVGASGANVMQHQDRADAGEERPHQQVRPAEVQRFQSRADDRRSHGRALPARSVTRKIRAFGAFCNRLLYA
jgi:hypothetical protein